MNKYTTIGQIKVNLKISLTKIIDFYSEINADEHGHAYLIVEMSKNTTITEIESLYLSSVSITDKHNENIFTGICVSTAIENQNGYQQLIIELLDHSVIADINRNTRTFQNPGKTLSDVLDEVFKQYSCCVNLKENPVIPSVVYQQNETDWQFALRMINSFGMHMYSGCRDKRISIAGGSKGGKSFSKSILDKQKSSSRNVGELRAVQLNADSTAAGYQYDSNEYTSANIMVKAGDIIGDYTVINNRIVNENGNFVNHLNLARTSDEKSSYSSSIEANIISNIITGTVISVSGNIVQVQFDADGADMSGNCVDIPYESAISNSFYCMPDIGDQVFVYYENNGKIVCLGSKRSSTDNPDFSKPEEKVLTNKDKMIRFTSSSLIVTDTRNKYDNEDDTEISIKFEDEGITVTSGSDILIENTEEGSMLLAAVSSPARLKVSQAQVASGKEKYKTIAENNNDAYISEGGMGYWDKFGAAASEELSRLGRDFLKNVSDNWDALTFKNIRNAATGNLFTDQEFGIEENKPAEQEETVSYDTGVVTIYGLNEITFKVKESMLIIDFNIYINAPKFGWMGYTKGTHEIVEEEYQDWWSLGLDMLQLGLDICGFIPGFGAFFDIANAAISLARGDFCGAAMSLVSAIPGIGDACAVAKVVGKAYKTAAATTKALTKVQKAYRMAKLIYKGVALIDSGVGSSHDIYMIGYDIANGKFDLSNPNDLARLAGVTKQLVGMYGSAKEIRDLGESVSTGDNKKKNHDNDSEHSKKNDGGDDPACDADTSTDPINFATGSLLAEYVDIGIEDVLGLYSLTRYYESKYKNTGGILGDMWRFGIESSVVIDGEFADVQLDDLHIEHFVKRDDQWINLRAGDSKYKFSETVEGYSLYICKEGKCYEYDKSGRLNAIVDIHDNRIKLEYIGEQLDRMVLSSGAWIKFYYQNKLLAYLEDNTGRRVKYTYEGKLLTSVCLPNGGTMYYSYTPEGYLTRLTDLNGKCFSTNYYDRKGRVIRQELEGGEEYVAFYDDVNHQNTFLTTSNGENLIYTYDQNKRITDILHPDGTRETRKYDESGNKILETDRYGRQTKRRFSINGELLSEIDAAGLECNYEYNHAGLVTRYYENTGREYINKYDEKNNLVSTSIKINENTWRKTEYTHDKQGRLLAIKNADGSIERYSYDTDFCMPSSHVSTSGNTTYYKYDNKGSLISSSDEFGTVEYGNNIMGHTTSIKDEEGNVTRYYYDNMANITKYIRPNGYNPNNDDGIGTEYFYDTWTYLSKVISPEREVSIYENDYLGNRLKEIKPNEVGKEHPASYTYEYDIERNPVKVIAPNGAVTYTEYDFYGNALHSMSPEEYKVFDESEEKKKVKSLLYNKNQKPGYRYEYDCMNRLVKVIDTDGVVEAAFVYDLNGRVIKEMSTADYLSADSDDKRTGTFYEYDYEGNVLSIRKPLRLDESGSVKYSLIIFDYDIMGRCISQKRFLDEQDKLSAKGRVNLISYSYDNAHRICRVTDSTGAVIEYEYNSRNQRTLERKKISEDVWEETAYEYSPAGNIVRMAVSADEDGCGRKYVSYRYTYDGNGNITRIQMPSGDEILREYDLCDRIIAEHYKEKNGSIDNSIKYSYDKNGNLVKINYQDGHTISMRYDVMDRLISRKEGNNSVTQLSYDLDGKLIGRINPNEKLALGEKAKGIRYHYDSKGRNTEIISPGGEVLYKAEYDKTGNIISEGNEEGVVDIVYDLAGRRTEILNSGNILQKYQYDASGNLIRLVDGNGNETVYETDLWGRVKVIGMADGSKENYTYDLAGNVSSATDGNGNTVYYNYNRINMLAERIDAAGKIEKFTYDILGRLKEHCDRDGRRMRYSYNMLGSPTEIKSELGEHMASYEYDRMGRLSAAIGGGMRYDYCYFEGGLLKEKRASGKLLVGYEYDEEGNKTKQVDLTGKETRYRYDFLGRLTDVSDATSNRILAKYEYTVSGNPSKKIVGGNIISEYGYDNMLNIESLIIKCNQQMLTQNKYAYDGNGNQIRREGLEGITSYVYDNRNRLVEATYPASLGGFTERISYDAAGNRLRRKTDKDITTYKYNNCNRLIELKREFKDVQSMSEIITFTYDNQGNMLSEGDKKYSYDSFGRQVKVEIPTVVNAGKSNISSLQECQVQINHYDGEGLRYELEENGALVKFLFNEDREVIAEENSERMISRYIRGLGIICSDNEEAKTYYHYVSDEQGSVTHILSDEAVILNRYAYDAFGNIISKHESVQNRFCYNGEMLDHFTQQYYLRARFYNPVIGRFTQEDTYYGDGMNLYNYCKSNPIGYIDPSGHYTCPIQQSLYEKYIKQGMSEQAAREKCEREYSKNGYYTDENGVVRRENGNQASKEEINAYKKSHNGNLPEKKSSKSGSKTYKNSSDITKDIRQNKPLNSPAIDAWYGKNGTISIDENGVWTYHDWEGNSVSYPNGYPDFKSAGMVRQEAPIGPFVERNKDFAKAREMGYIKSADGTWHHHEDGVTLQEVETILHDRFRHRGGISNLKKK